VSVHLTHAAPNIVAADRVAPSTRGARGAPPELSPGDRFATTGNVVYYLLLVAWVQGVGAPATAIVCSTPVVIVGLFTGALVPRALVPAAILLGLNIEGGERHVRYLRLAPPTEFLGFTLVVAGLWSMPGCRRIASLRRSFRRRERRRTVMTALILAPEH
jgi:hypothetical protein